MANANLMSMAPLDCFIIDEATTQPNDENLTDDGSFLALALQVEGESFEYMA